jgi:hypothetical protein
MFGPQGKLLLRWQCRRTIRLQAKSGKCVIDWVGDRLMRVLCFKKVERQQARDLS